MKLTKFYPVLVGLFVLGGASPMAEAAEPPSEEVLAAKFRELQPQSGTVVLDNGLATIRLPEGLQFLSPKDARTILVDFWGNPPGAADGVLGMLVLSPQAALGDEGWGIVITYTEDGHVDDADAAKIDFAKLLRDMQAGVRDANKERVQKGYPTVDLVGWAEPPRYDAGTHKIYWAKELRFGDSQNDTLNYCTRILGRRGVLELNAVAPAGALPEIRKQMQAILGDVDFNPGNRYADFDASTDKLATYGIAALVAGGAAAKMGLFKGLLVAALAAKKFIILGIAAAGGFFAKWFKGRTVR